LLAVVASFSESLSVGGMWCFEAAASSFGVEVGSSYVECELLLLEASAGVSLRSKTKLPSVSELFNGREGGGTLAGKTRVALPVEITEVSRFVGLAEVFLNRLFGFEITFL
jgi:hypothetical protein